MATFDVLNERLYPQTLKTNVVICRQSVQGFGDITIPLPVGVTIDPVTGEFNVPVTIAPAGTPILINNTVIPDKVINNGAIPVNVLVSGVSVVQNVMIPWQDVIDCPGVRPGDEVQKHDFLVTGLIVTAVLGTPGGLQLKAVYDYCLIVARLKLISVSAADITC